MLTHFEIIPILYSDISAESLLSGVKPIFDENSLFLISTDLSHYYEYKEALRKRCTLYYGMLKNSIEKHYLIVRLVAKLALKQQLLHLKQLKTLHSIINHRVNNYLQ